MVNQIFIVTLYYFFFLVLILAMVGAIFKGFFWKYLKVRMSFGKYVLVKVRASIRDYFAVGRVEEDYLIYKRRGAEIRILITDNIFYKSLSVLWVDVDESLNAACKVDYTGVKGYDAERFDDLYTRALMKPAIKSNFEKIIILICLGSLVAAGAAAYLAYLSYSNSQTILTISQTILDAVRATSQTIAAKTTL